MIQEYLEKRRKHQQTQAWQNGFKWAMKEIILGEHTVETVEMHQEAQIDYGSFDAGVSDACDHLRHLIGEPR